MAGTSTVLVAALCAMSGSGGATEPPRASAPPRTISLVFEAQPTRAAGVTPRALRRTTAVMRARIADLGLRGATIEPSGRHRIAVSLPDVRAAAEAQRRIEATGRLVFYDWETHVVGRDGRPHPADSSVTGGALAGQPGAGTRPYYEAVGMAARMTPTHEADDTTDGLLYGVDDATRRVACGPQPTIAAARGACARAGKRATRYVVAPRGWVVVRSEAGPHAATQVPASNACYVLRDDPSIVGDRDLENPRQDFDHGPGVDGRPTVTFAFTRGGARRWRALTRAVARRGHANVLAGGDPNAAAAHFAVVLDGKLISVPYIDPVQSPGGLEPSNGAEISGDFTIRSARRLASIMRSGPLPLSVTLVAKRRAPR